MQQAAVKEIDTHTILGRRLQLCAAAISILLLCAVPLTFLTVVHRFYTLPRFALLLTGSSILVAILALLWADSRRAAGIRAGDIRTRQLILAALYILWIGLSTIFGVAPIVSLFGSFENQMGLLTHLCFFVCFLGLIVGVGRSRARLEMALWAMVLTALAVAA